MTETPGEISEETSIEETEEAPVEAVEAEIPVEEEGPQKIIQLRPPPPFDEEALEPFIDYFMQARGLSDRKQAAFKLATVLFSIGYNPQREIQNVSTYIQNLSSVMDRIPNLPETLPVKGSLLATGALDSSNMLKRTHFGGGTDEDELKGMFRFAQKAKMTMHMLDNIFTGEGNMSGKPNEAVTALATRLDRIEKRSEFEQQLNPIKEQLKTLSEKIGKIGEKPPGAGEASPELKKLQDKVDKLVDTIGKQKEQDAFTAGFEGLKTEFKTLGDAIKAKGGAGSQDATTVFDQAVTLMDKISDVTKKYGGGEGSDVDWRSVAISTAGEIGTEAIKAARDIMSGKGEGELREESKVAPEEKAGKITQRIIDRKLLGYIQKRVAAGAFDLDSREAAKDLGVTSDDIIDSYKRLRDAGLVTTPGTKKQKPGDRDGGTGESKVESQWVEG
ncbi:hypothetical protein ES703_81225 [subsurface metagenome]